MGFLTKMFKREPVVVDNRVTSEELGWHTNPGFHPLRYVPSELHLSTDEIITDATVWACIREIVDPIATSEVRIYSKDLRGRKIDYPDDSVAWLFNWKPNPAMSAQAFKEALLTSTIIFGNGYAEIVFDMAGRPTALFPLISERMQYHQTPDGDDFYYVYQNPNGSQVVLETWQVLHVSGPSINGFMGDSILTRAAKAAALSVAVQRYATSYFANGTILGGIIEVPKGTSMETVERRKADIEGKYKGAAKAHKMAFLPEGAKYTPFATDADKSQLIPVREFSVLELARFFRIHPSRLGVPQATQGYGNNQNAFNLSHFRDCLAPWVNRLIEPIQTTMLPQRAPWKYVELDMSQFIEGDKAANATTGATLLNAGILTVNEVREFLGYDAMPGGDKLKSLAPPPAPPMKPEPMDEEDVAEEDVEDPADEQMMNVATVLEKTARKVKARRVDLTAKGHTPEAIATNLAGVRAKAFTSYPGLKDEAIVTALDAIEAGVAPIKAAEFMLTGGAS